MVLENPQKRTDLSRIITIASTPPAPPLLKGLNSTRYNHRMWNVANHPDRHQDHHSPPWRPRPPQLPRTRQRKRRRKGINFSASKRPSFVFLPHITYTVLCKARNLFNILLVMDIIIIDKDRVFLSVFCNAFTRTYDTYSKHKHRLYTLGVLPVRTSQPIVIWFDKSS